MSEVSITREQLKAMGLTDEQIDAYLGVANNEDAVGMPFPLIKINFDSDLGKVGALGFNPKKDENGSVVEYEKVFDTPFKIRLLKTAYQYTKFDPTTNKVTVASNIFESLKEAKNAYDVKTGIAISQLKEKDDQIKLSRVILVELIDDNGERVYGIWFVKGIYLYELNEILRKFPNEGHLNKILKLGHKKHKKGMVTYFTPELIKDDNHDIMETIKEDSEKIVQFTDWIRKGEKSSAQTNTNTQKNSNNEPDDISFEDDEDIPF